MARDNPDILAQRSFRLEQLEAKRKRAVELAADPELTRSASAQRLGVHNTAVGEWLRAAGARVGDGRKVR
jgi:transposase-like protein